LISFFLAVSFAQLEDSLADLTSLPEPAAGGGWCGSTRIAWACAGTNGRLVQGALLGVTHGGRLGCWLGFLRLLGHHDGLLGRSHHRANGLGFRQGLAATLFQIAGTRRFFFGTGLGLSGCLFAGFILGCGTGSRFGLLLACSFLLLRRGLRLLGGFLGSVGGGALFSFAFTALALFTLSTFGSQFSFLVANQLSLAAGFFLAANQFLVLARHGGFFHAASRAWAAGADASAPSSRWMKVRFLRTSTWIVRALPVASACLISLVDFFTMVIFLRSAEAVPWLACR
jgi:hypothetical protein